MIKARQWLKDESFALARIRTRDPNSPHRMFREPSIVVGERAIRAIQADAIREASDMLVDGCIEANRCGCRNVADALYDSAVILLEAAKAIEIGAIQ